MASWVRFDHNGLVGFGTLHHDAITIHQGDMFANPTATSASLSLDEVKVLTPTVPGKMIALWNNFFALAEKLNLSVPSEPLYFLKADSSYLATGETIRCPAAYDGKVVFEGELGIVMGRVCRAVSDDEAKQYIFGYTCINDVTAIELINKDRAFQQWARAKSFDTFGVFGPVVSTDLNPAELTVKTELNGQERQNYRASDMIFQPARLVSLLSQDMTLYPGDVICCGTSVGVGSMKPGSTIAVTIDGIGTLVNRFEKSD
ncbi:MAG: fumarylacetoacetate hydrolase family protein [Gammaproteobacteria bacterium]|nr:fumarylacetoacetate hydrolase family protein [Gammaproteobacteria bacterium]